MSSDLNRLEYLQVLEDNFPALISANTNYSSDQINEVNSIIDNHSDIIRNLRSAVKADDFNKSSSRIYHANKLIVQMQGNAAHLGFDFYRFVVEYCQANFYDIGVFILTDNHIDRVGRMEPLKIKELIVEIKKTLSLYSETEEGRREVWDRLAQGCGMRSQVAPLARKALEKIPVDTGDKPQPPPRGELYTQRTTGENAPQFIKRVYGQWLTGEFTRADLRKIDPKAEMALRNWEKKHGRAPLNLPTKKEKNDRLLAESNLEGKPEAVKLYDALRARRRRERKITP